MTLLPAPPAPPPVEAARLRRIRRPLAAGALAALGSVALHVRDPHEPGSWGICPTALLGLDCPGCGSLRAVHELTHGQLAAAASSNLLLVLAIPVVAVLWIRRLAVTWVHGSLAPPATPPAWVWGVLLVVMTVFTVLRNLPVGAWLHS